MEILKLIDMSVKKLMISITYRGGLEGMQEICQWGPPFFRVNYPTSLERHCFQFTYIKI